MTSIKRRIACFCETTFEAEVPASADCAEDPDVVQSIVDGDFMAVTCPACGKRLTPEYPFRLTAVQGFGEVLLVPEPDRAALARGKLDVASVGTSAGHTAARGIPGRVVVGFAELAEKVTIAGLGLDDRVIEIMKYYLLTGSASKAGEDAAAAEDVTVRYRGIEQGKHLFHIVGMKKDEVGVARLAPELYARIAGDIGTRVTEEPFRDFCTPPWVSLRRVSGGAA
jgi:hypothetical protein